MENSNNVNETAKKLNSIGGGLQSLGCLIILIPVIWIMFNLVFCGKSSITINESSNNRNISETTTSKLDWSHYYSDDDHIAVYMTILQEGVNKYISGVKWPWSFREYSFIDYDNTNSGTILGNVRIEINNLIEKQDVYVIFTISDVEKYKINSVVVGNKVYYDDGKVEKIMNMFK